MLTSLELSRAEGWEKPCGKALIVPHGCISGSLHLSSLCFCFLLTSFTFLIRNLWEKFGGAHISKYPETAVLRESTMSQDHGQRQAPLLLLHPPARGPVPISPHTIPHAYYFCSACARHKLPARPRVEWVCPARSSFTELSCSTELLILRSNQKLQKLKVGIAL